MFNSKIQLAEVIMLHIISKKHTQLYLGQFLSGMKYSATAVANESRVRPKQTFSNLAGRPFTLQDFTR